MPPPAAPDAAASMAPLDPTDTGNASKLSTPVGLLGPLQAPNVLQRMMATRVSSAEASADGEGPKL